ncbi:unnamed protein product [Euphydryas editha]|uniref:Uncharacterized protein n=1 Tax=Euphydryas editha TaxID=104508 RepID=A0AAU9URC1_EUPED|nr:unnamed protein product [Euphydryas editha]
MKTRSTLTFFDEESSASCNYSVPRQRCDLISNSSRLTSDASTFTSKISLPSSLSRFREDFNELKCKMRIFGESVSLCHCIADDYQKRMTFLEKRLQNLEEQHQLMYRENNYSAIIQKNKLLSNRTRQEAKVSTLTNKNLKLFLI